MRDLVLWNTDGTSDKVWGVVTYQSRLIRFWGRRTAELSFKLLDEREQRGSDKMADKKRREGYREIDFAALEAEQPGWRDNFDNMLMMAILGDNYRNTSQDTIAGS